MFIIAIGGSLIIFDIINSYIDFYSRSDEMRSAYIANQKQIIKREVENVAEMCMMYSKVGIKFDKDKNIQKNLLKTISKIRFNKEGYIFINKLNGDVLVSNGKVFDGTKKLWEVFNKYPEKTKKLFKKEYNAAMKLDGDFIYYSFIKLSNIIKESPKSSFIYGIPELQWLIGAGVYLDDIEENITQIHKELNKQVQIRIVYIILTIIGLIILFLFALKFLTNKLINDYKLFVSFFNKTVLSNEEINHDLLYFIEFDKMAKYANKMRRELLKSDKKYKNLFNANPVSLWEEDLSGVKIILERIANKGDIITDEYFDKNPDIVTECLSAIKVLNINMVTLDLLKYDTIEELKQNFSAILNKNSIQTFKRELVAIANKTSFSEETEFVLKDGTIIPAIVQFQFVGNFDSIIFAITDITKQKIIGDKLKRSEENYKNLFNENPLALWEEDFSEVKNKLDIIKKKGMKINKEYFDKNPNFFDECRATITISDINKATLQLLKYKDLNELENNNSSILNDKTLETIKNEFIAISNDETSFSEESELIRSDGVTLNVIVQFNVIGTYKKILFSITDITERKKTEEELKKIQMLKSVGTLAGGIAHDFNNILMGLFGNISMAKTKLSKEHQSYKYLEDAESSMNWATGLTKQLLTFAKGGTPVKEDIRISQLIEEIVKFDLSGSNVKPVIKYKDNLWLADVDKGQMQQVFSNLTINANQAMPDGGHLFISIENANSHEGLPFGLIKGKYLKIIIKDEGAGIDKKHIDRIFDPYFSTKQTGSGLGLATVYSIINKHNGHIHIESSLGNGTMFTIYLPASTYEQAENIESIEQKPSFIKQNAKILIMDDEEVILNVTTDMLENFGFIVETAIDGKTTIEMYEQALHTDMPFDVLIMDLTIPGGFGGKEVIKELLRIDPEVKAIVSSGYADDPVMAKYSDYGFKGIIAKPYLMDELEEVLNKVLLGREAERQVGREDKSKRGK